MSLVVSRVTFEDPLRKEDSEAILTRFALRPEVSKAAIGVLAVLHAVGHSQGAAMTVPADCLDELTRLGMIHHRLLADATVAVSLRRP